MNQGKLPAKASFTATVALIWATPMSAFFCWLFWKFGALSLGTALAINLTCALAGWGLGALVYQLVRRRDKSVKRDGTDRASG